MPLPSCSTRWMQTVHEAGHCVCAAFLGATPIRAVVCDPRPGSRVGGETEYATAPWSALSVLEKCTATWGGVAAESIAVFRPVCCPAGLGDEARLWQHCIGMSASQAKTVILCGQGLAAVVVQRKWGAVLEIARELDQRSALNATQLAEILGQFGL